MFSIEELQNKINNALSQVQLDLEPKELYEPIKYTFKSGGKRIRPALVLAANNLFSESVDKAIPIALAFEVFHNFTLLHDDIMDHSPIRRGKETVHVKWDANTAILSGDAMMIKAYDYLKELPPKLMKPIFVLYNKTALEVCEGQQYDMNFETRTDVAESEYLEMIRLKTSVLIAACLKAGALAAKAKEKDADLLYDFGINIGLAFQLQDDLLDVYADTELFGKQTGNDIITGKKTFLLINAYEKADSSTKNELTELLNNKELEKKEKIQMVTDIYNRLGIKELTEQKIVYYHEKALKSLEAVSCKNEKKKIVSGFAEQIMNRKK